MFSLHQLLKLGYVLVLGTVTLTLCQPEPVRAQRALLAPLAPANQATPLQGGWMSAYTQAQAMLMQAGIPTGSMSGNGTGLSMMGMGGGGMQGMGGGGMQGMGGGMMGMSGGMGMGGMNGGGMGMGGMGMGGMSMMGMAGGMGMGGFAGKGMGGFNGRKPL